MAVCVSSIHARLWYSHLNNKYGLLIFCSLSLFYSNCKLLVGKSLQLKASADRIDRICHKNFKWIISEGLVINFLTSSM